MCVQYIGSVQCFKGGGGGGHEYIRGYLEYIRGCSVHQRAVTIYVGSIINTFGIFSPSEEYHDECGGGGGEVA